MSCTPFNVCDLSTYAVYTILVICFFLFVRWVTLEIRYTNGILKETSSKDCYICGTEHIIGITMPFGSAYDGEAICQKCCIIYLDHCIEDGRKIYDYWDKESKK